MRSSHTSRKWAILLLVTALMPVVSACDSEPTTPGAPVIVSQTPRADAVLQLPTPLPTSTEAVEPAATQAPTLVTRPAGAEIEPAVRYRLVAELDWPARTVQVDERIELHNGTGAPLRELLFTVEANGDSELFDNIQIATGSGATLDDYALNGATLVVRLPEPLAPEALLTLEISYALAIPTIRAGYRYGHLGYLGYSHRQVNLGNWFPLLAHYDAANGWVSPLPHTVGEQAARRLADFDVTLRVTGAPDGLAVAAPGRVTRDDGEWRFVVEGAREFAMSLSDSFEVVRTRTASGVEVEVYTLAGTAPESARHALQVAADALSLFERLYHWPYAHQRMIVVEGDFPDGMEFSGLVFVSSDWFRAWQGVPNDWLTLITAHEVSHQWWYSAVGSDQGQHPYLDEALAIYSELLYFERYWPEHVTWWWDFRVNAYGPTGLVDGTVYDFHAPRPYINAVYLQGARMMQDLRNDLGDLAFFGWLQRYAAQMSGQLATPADLWGAMTGEEYAATLATRQRYLRNTHVLARSSDLP